MSLDDDFIDKDTQGVQYAIVDRADSLLSVLRRQFPQYSKDVLFSFVLCGNIKVDEEKVKDHTRLVSKDSVLALYDEQKLGKKLKSFVSRGGNKLEPVLEQLEIDVFGKIWLDCGSSTGGFTDCLLQRGAAVVHAVDVGSNMLDYKLRVDARVQVYEKTNVSDLNELQPPPQSAVVDLSFRSLRGIARHILDLCTDQYALALCKPQFEYAAEIKKKKHAAPLAENEFYTHKEINAFDGVLHDKALIEKVLYGVLCDLFREKVYVARIFLAGIRGTEGNQEFFLELKSTQDDMQEKTVFEHYKVIIQEALKAV